MILSSPDVKKFLLEVIDQAAFPGRHAEFVASVKAEVASATFDAPQAIGNTSSDLMEEARARR
jgi:hypothetical protein